MAFIIKDRVKEGTTTTGTGDITLNGAAATFDTFQSYMTNGDTTYYAIVHTTSGTDEWEVGIGTWNTGNTLTRTTVLAGSNGSNAENFSAGTKDVFMTYPASKAVYTDASGDIDINGGTIDGTTIGANSHTTGKFTTLQATGNVDFDGYIDMNPISHPTHSEGRVYYDSAHKSLSYQSDISDVDHEIGLEEHVRVYNNSGSTIAKGKPVYWSGNQNDVPTIGLANATSSTKYNVQGLTAGSIANNSYGYVIVSGLVYDIDTSSLNAGDNFFAGLTDGALQNASPTYPNFPMCLGWVIKSDASTGIVLVNQQNHSVNSFRVRTSAHIGDDLIVGGDLTVLGSQTIASSENVSIANAWNYFNSGDTIGALNTNFSGSGLNDASFTGHFTGTTSTTYYVRIDGVGTGTGGVDTFEWSTDNFATTVATGVDITGDDQLIHSTDNIAVKFEATTGHTSGDTWTGTAAPLAVDTGFATNRNTGTSGVGYTHMGIYYDVSTDKWTVFDEYDPEPEGTIDTSHASFNYGTLKAGTFEGDLSGDVTGDVTGTATSANALATARTIGGVSFDGTANINLPGVNTTGNQDTTGNAATATALETSRTIQLTGDVTGSATFDGTANATITAVVQDDSHSHIISNVDGLQAALDDKADDTITVTAGNGLTGGGDLSANRTLTVGAGTGVTVNANDVAIGQDVATTASPTFAAATINGNITVTGTVDGRDVAADGTKLDGIETGATADQTASEILTAIKTVDGSGSGLDADTLDGNHASAFLTGNQTITLSGDATGSGTTSISVSLAADSVDSSEIAANAVGASELNVTGNGTTSQFLRSDGDGTFTWATPTDTNTTYSAGSGLSLSGTTFSHTDTSSQSSVNNTGRTYIQDITLDTYGHVTGISSATETVTNTDTTYSAGSGLSLSGTTFSHSNTSSASSVNNSGNTFIQDITVDTYGHITAISSATASSTAASVPSGSVMIFAQTSAPSGWTKSTTHNNKALRVVSGTASSGGNQAFTTAFASRTTSSTTAGGSISNTTAGGSVGSTTLSTSQMPSHNHQASTYTTVVGWSGNSPGRVFSNNLNYSGGGAAFTGSTGGSGSHNHSFSGSSHNHTFTGSSHSHTLDMEVQYVDVILASKD